MILFVHMLFGAAIGATAASLGAPLWLAVLLALLSHYFLDLFPHIEYLKSVESAIQGMKRQGLRQALSDGLKVLLDFLLGLLAVALLSGNSWTGYLFSATAVIPDGLTVVSNLWPNRLSAAHDKVHTGYIHFLRHKKVSLFWRIATQAVAALVSAAVLLRR